MDSSNVIVGTALTQTLCVMETEIVTTQQTNQTVQLVILAAGSVLLISSSAPTPYVLNTELKQEPINLVSYKIYGRR